MNDLMMQGRAYKGMPPELGGTSLPQQQNSDLDVSQSVFAQPPAFGLGNGLSSPAMTPPLTFPNGAGAFGVPYSNGELNSGANQLGGAGFGAVGYSSQPGNYPAGQGLGIPKQNTPTGYPPPVSGNKINDVMFSVFQGVGIALKIRMALNAQKQQQKELEVALQQSQLEGLLNRGNQLQGDMHSQWAEQDRLYEEAERRLGKPQAISPKDYGEIGAKSVIKRQALAAKAKQVASQMNTKGYCARGVQNALEELGISVERSASAYQMADKLAARSDMEEVSGSPEVGDIVVYNRTSDKLHGHVAIQLANNQQASDHISGNANPHKYGGMRVFRPVAT